MIKQETNTHIIYLMKEFMPHFHWVQIENYLIESGHPTSQVGYTYPILLLCGSTIDPQEIIINN
jgi:hypothetical protein